MWNQNLITAIFNVSSISAQSRISECVIETVTNTGHLHGIHRRSNPLELPDQQLDQVKCGRVKNSEAVFDPELYDVTRNWVNECMCSKVRQTIVRIFCLDSMLQ